MVSRRRGLGFAVAVLALLWLAAGPLLDGEQARRVHIRWRPTVDAATQDRLETRYGLRQRVGADRSYGYDLVDPSPRNIRALVDDPAVEDTQDIDREQATVAAGADRGDLGTGWAWRWRFERRLPAARRAAQALVLAGLVLLLWPARGGRLAQAVAGRGRVLAGGAVAAAGVAALAMVPWLAGSPSRTIVVQWRDGMDQDARLELQARHGGTRNTGAAWRWRLERWLPWWASAGALLTVAGAAMLMGGARLRRAAAAAGRYARAAADRSSRSVAQWIAGRRHAVGVVGVFLLALALRWTSMTALGGDDHWSLWTAATFLNGDRPFQEFVDPGDPLYWGASALAQLLVGYRAIGEIGLGLLLIAFAIAVSFRLSWQASGSAALAFVLALVTIALVMPTKLYSYPKIFLYPLNLWLAWRYIDRPSPGRAVQLAAGVAVAFGYRHDHGAYTAVGASAAVIAAHVRDGALRSMLALIRVGGATLAILSPYFLLVQVNEGLVPYFRERMRFAAQTDAAGRRTVPFVVDRSKPWTVAVEPPPPVALAVRWRADALRDGSTALEARYGLTPAVAAMAGGWRRYFITDYSLANLTALLAERRVVTLEGIVGSFRQGFALDDEAAPRLMVYWRNATADAVAARERQYRLARRSGAAVTTAGVAYDVADPSVANITALRQDPLVERIDGVHFVRVPVEARLRERVPVGPPVSVRWRDGLGRSDQAELERRFSLSNGEKDPRDPRQVMWSYELSDPSPATVTALVTDPAVTEFDQVERRELGLYAARPWSAPRGGRLSVVWTPMSESERQRLEARYHLDPAVEAPDGFVAYTLQDGSVSAIAALAAAPEVAELTGIDRSRSRVTGEGWFATLRRQFAALRVIPVPRLFVKENGGVWLYYLAFAVPFATLAVLLVDLLRGASPAGMPQAAQKMFAAAVLMGVANLGLLRKLGYFPDHFDVTIVMAAWLIARGLRHWRSVAGLAVATVVVLVSGTSLVSAATYVDLPTLASRYRLDMPLSEQLASHAERFRAFATSPPIDLYAPADATADRAMVRYLYECTRPDDRIFVTSDVYTVPYYTQRRVVGHIFWANGLLATPEFEERMVALMERDPVPVVFGVGGERPLDNLRRYPRIQAYVAARYTEQHAILQDQLAGTVLWLLIDSRRTPTGIYARLGLPCLR